MDIRWDKTPLSRNPYFDAPEGRYVVKRRAPRERPRERRFIVLLNNFDVGGVWSSIEDAKDGAEWYARERAAS